MPGSLWRDTLNAGAVPEGVQKRPADHESAGAQENNDETARYEIDKQTATPSSAP